MARHSGTIIENQRALNSWLVNIARPLVFTNGCFDILHRGHIAYLQKAASLGASLFVALNTDQSVKRLNKGSDRPINPLADRLAVLSALGCVDAVYHFDEDTPLKLIQSIQPQVLVKGGDWPVDQIVGSQEVRSWGGECHSIVFEFERSTTALVNKIKSA